MSWFADFLGPWRGFAVTFRQMFKPKVTVRYPKEKRIKPVRFHGRHVLNRYPGRHGEVHRLRTLRRGLPGALHLRAGRRQPARRPGEPRGAVRFRLRDQHAAVHLLRPVRRSVSDRGDHDDPPLRDVGDRSRRCHLHEGPNCSWPPTVNPTTPSPRRSLVDLDELTAPPAGGCGPPPRRVAPHTKE